MEYGEDKPPQLDIGCHVIAVALPCALRELSSSRRRAEAAESRAASRTPGSRGPRPRGPRGPRRGTSPRGPLVRASPPRAESAAPRTARRCRTARSRGSARALAPPCGLKPVLPMPSTRLVTASASGTGRIPLHSMRGWSIPASARWRSGNLTPFDVHTAPDRPRRRATPPPRLRRRAPAGRGGLILGSSCMKDSCRPFYQSCSVAAPVRRLHVRRRRVDLGVDAGGSTRRRVGRRERPGRAGRGRRRRARGRRHRVGGLRPAASRKSSSRARGGARASA